MRKFGDLKIGDLILKIQGLLPPTDVEFFRVFEKNESQIIAIELNHTILSYEEIIVPSIYFERSFFQNTYGYGYVISDSRIFYNYIIGL